MNRPFQCVVVLLFVVLYKLQKWDSNWGPSTSNWYSNDRQFELNLNDYVKTFGQWLWSHPTLEIWGLNLVKHNFNLLSTVLKIRKFEKKEGKGPHFQNQWLQLLWEKPQEHVVVISNLCTGWLCNWLTRTLPRLYETINTTKRDNITNHISGRSLTVSI